MLMTQDKCSNYKVLTILSNISYVTHLALFIPPFAFFVDRRKIITIDSIVLASGGIESCKYNILPVHSYHAVVFFLS